jgi:hypothetical protein
MHCSNPDNLPKESKYFDYMQYSQYHKTLGDPQATFPGVLVVHSGCNPEEPESVVHSHRRYSQKHSCMVFSEVVEVAENIE